MRIDTEKICKKAETAILKFKEPKNAILTISKGSFIEKHRGAFVIYHKHSKLPLAKVKTFERSKALCGILESVFPLSKTDAQSLNTVKTESMAVPFEKKFAKSLALSSKIEKFLEDRERAEGLVEKVIHDRMNARLEMARGMVKSRTKKKK